MAWSWSHTDEAYINAENNLRRQDRKWLQTCYAEIRSYERDLARHNEERVAEGEEPDNFPVCPDNHFNNLFYEEEMQKAKEMWTDDLIEAIWIFANEYRTCTNGGWEAYMCPFACHTVPFSPPGEDEE